VYLMPMPAWTEQGSVRFPLPAVDLPVSRTGLRLHYSPRFEIEALPGIFRVEPYQPPWSTALTAPAVAESRPAKPVPPNAAASSPGVPPAPASGDDKDAAGARLLVERFRREGAKTAAGVIPVHVTVPEIGPAIFAAAELTAESQVPIFEIAYKRANVR
jgi:hypothetical protein